MLDILKSADAVAALPELILAVSAMVLLMIGAFKKAESSDLVNSLALLALAIAGGAVILDSGETQTAFHGVFIVDTFARFMKVLVLFGSAAAIIMSVQFMKNARIAQFEYPVLILLATTGMLMMVSANGLIALYMGLELQSLALYVVAAINRDSTRSSEAGVKYFVLGALSSGMLLYGASLIYGFTGTTTFDGIAAFLKANDSGLGLTIGVVFLITGLAFKISAVPFHMWTPDVYEGAPTPVAAFFATAPKVAAMAMFVRAMIGPFPAIAGDWQQILVFISIASMVLGAFAAIGQTNIKRLLAYSSIGHMGYALSGLAAGSTDGVRGVVLYMTIYMLTTIGTFGCVLAMRRNDQHFEEISDLAGLSQNSKIMAFVMAMFMFSLAGIPPLAGFFAKYVVFLAAYKAGLLPLVIIGLWASVVSAFYYIRVVLTMYVQDPEDVFDPIPGEIKLTIGVAFLFVLLFVGFGSPLFDIARAAAASLF
jgi:NADH-quinone oxidoreductase subunit N